MDLVWVVPLLVIALMVLVINRNDKPKWTHIDGDLFIDKVKECDCGAEWAEGLTQQALIETTGKPFFWCPWCGKKLFK